MLISFSAVSRYLQRSIERLQVVIKVEDRLRKRLAYSLPIDRVLTSCISAVLTVATRCNRISIAISLTTRWLAGYPPAVKRLHYKYNASSSALESSCIGSRL